MVYTLRFSSSNCSLFHNSNVFVPVVFTFLYTGCAKIKKKKSGAKRLREWVCTRKVECVYCAVGTEFLLQNRHVSYLVAKIEIEYVSILSSSLHRACLRVI